MSEQRQSDRPQGAPATSSGYLLVVGTLLVVIIALLAILWARERSGRMAAESTAAGWKYGYECLRGSLEQMLADQQAVETPIDRQSLPAEQVTLNGQPAVALRIDGESGRAMGLAPGDVLIVATMPATQPGSPP